MPPKSKASLDANIAFLYLCMQKSNLTAVRNLTLSQLHSVNNVSLLDYKQIDFPAVARALNLKENAARMRYYRLKKALEDSESKYGGDSDQAAEPASTPKSTPANITSKKASKTPAPKKSFAKSASAKRKTTQSDYSSESESEAKKTKKEIKKSPFKETEVKAKLAYKKPTVEDAPEDDE